MSDNPKADILVVDDTPVSLRLMTGMLKDRGYRVRPVPSGKLALRAAATAAPDLVLLDINMPEMDGYEVCRRMKEDAALREIPIIFLSGLTDTTDKVQAFTSGGVDYITKPFKLKEVEARIETHLRLRRLQGELEAKNRRLEQSYEQQRELEALRDSLTHMMVHDMRSPLASLSTALYMLKEDLGQTISAESLGDLDLARRNAETVLRMINDLLDVNRLESGELPLKLIPQDLVAITNEAVSALRGLTRGRDVEVEHPVALPLTCDGDIIRRVLENLIGNGLKHTPKQGGLRIALSAMSGDDYVRAEVRDDGPGIPEDYRETIFEKFGQVKSRQEGQYHSTGLGLAFCKLAVEAHGGTIGVESEEGLGCNFWVELPLR